MEDMSSSMSSVKLKVQIEGQSGGVHLPGSIAGRTFISCWWLMCLVMVGIYSGNLIAFLTVTKENPPFNTLEEMVENEDYKYGTLGGTVWEYMFMTSSIPIFKTTGDGMRQFQETEPGVLSVMGTIWIASRKGDMHG